MADRELENLLGKILKVQERQMRALMLYGGARAVKGTLLGGGGESESKKDFGDSPRGRTRTGFKTFFDESGYQEFASKLSEQRAKLSTKPSQVGYMKAGLNLLRRDLSTLPGLRTIAEATASSKGKFGKIRVPFAIAESMIKGGIRGIQGLRGRPETLPPTTPPDTGVVDDIEDSAESSESTLEATNESNVYLEKIADNTLGTNNRLDTLIEQARKSEEERKLAAALQKVKDSEMKDTLDALKQAILNGGLGGLGGLGGVATAGTGGGLFGAISTGLQKAIDEVSDYIKYAIAGVAAPAAIGGYLKFGRKTIGGGLRLGAKAIKSPIKFGQNVINRVRISGTTTSGSLTAETGGLAKIRRAYNISRAGGAGRIASAGEGLRAARAGGVLTKTLLVSPAILGDLLAIQLAEGEEGNLEIGQMGNVVDVGSAKMLEGGLLQTAGGNVIDPSSNPQVLNPLANLFSINEAIIALSEEVKNAYAESDDSKARVLLRSMAMLELEKVNHASNLSAALQSQGIDLEEQEMASLLDVEPKLSGEKIETVLGLPTVIPTNADAMVESNLLQAKNELNFWEFMDADYVNDAITLFSARGMEKAKLLQNPATSGIEDLFVTEEAKYLEAGYDPGFYFFDKYAAGRDFSQMTSRRRNQIEGIQGNTTNETFTIPKRTATSGQDIQSDGRQMSEYERAMLYNQNITNNVDARTTTPDTSKPSTPDPDTARLPALY